MNDRRKIISAVDIGYGWTKAAARGKIWRQPSILGEPRKLFENDLRETDVTYKAGKDSFFVGDLAQRHSQVTYSTTKDNKAATWTTNILLKASLGITAGSNSLYLVTGLPVDYYFNQKQDFKDLLENFNTNESYIISIGGSDWKVRPWILKNKIVPQPFGSAMNYLLDKRGQIKDKKEANKRILVVDVGYYTLDLLILDSMEIGKDSCSPKDLGIDTAYKILREYLKDEIGKAPGRYDLDRYVLSGEYQGYNITDLTNKAFQALADQITLEIESLNTTFHKYIITGGWAEKIAKMLTINQKAVITYGQLGNLEGYEKVGRRVWPTL